MARLGFFFFTRSRSVIWTHVSRVAPDWDLLDALPTELQRRGKSREIDSSKFALEKSSAGKPRIASFSLGNLPNYAWDVMIFFARTVCIKLVSPQAAQLSMCIFMGKSVMIHLHEGPD